MTANEQFGSPAMRSVFDRMTNPQESDQKDSINRRLKDLSYAEIDRIVVNMGLIFKHMADQRTDLQSEYSRDENGWTIRLSIANSVSSPVANSPGAASAAGSPSGQD